MNTKSDNSHATRKILGRVVDQYDLRRSWFPEETEATARHIAIDALSHLACIDYVPAAELLADALARRASKEAEGFARLASRKEK